MAGAFDTIPAGAIKSIQRGVTTPGTVTISPVNPAKTELRFLGFMSAPGNATVGVRIALASPTTLAVGGFGTDTVSWELTERY